MKKYSQRVRILSLPYFRKNPALERFSLSAKSNRILPCNQKKFSDTSRDKISRLREETPQVNKKNTEQF